MAKAIDYVPIDIDMADDAKVSIFLDVVSEGDAGARFAAYGRLVALLQRIYHEGFYLKLGRIERLKLAKDMGLDAEGLDSFLEQAVEFELLDRGMFDEGALTSRGIQRRYFAVKKRGKGGDAVPDEDRPYLLVVSDGRAAAGGAGRTGGSREIPNPPEVSREAPNPPENSRERPSSPENAREVPKSPEIFRKSPLREDKRREDKKREDEEEENARASARGGARGRAPSSSSEEEGGGDAALPSMLATAYPLACMSAVADPAGGYCDDAGGTFDTPWDALVSAYGHRTRGQPIDAFARQVARLCPRDCPCTLERVEGCARMLRRAVDLYDPAKGANPFPLARKIIEDERGGAR